MKIQAGIIGLIFLLLHSAVTEAQDNLTYKNRMSFGFGGENGYFGIDYSRSVYKSKIFLGIGSGIGTGWTGYVRYEPFNWSGFSPFISPGISHAFGGTLMLSAGSTTLSMSGGVNYLPKIKWRVLPAFGIGLTYYHLLNGEEENGNANGIGPLLKIGIAFTGKKDKS